MRVRVKYNANFDSVKAMEWDRMWCAYVMCMVTQIWRSKIMDLSVMCVTKVRRISLSILIKLNIYIQSIEEAFLVIKITSDCFLLFLVVAHVNEVG